MLFLQCLYRIHLNEMTVFILSIFAISTKKKPGSEFRRNVSMGGILYKYYCLCKIKTNQMCE